jgi:hypothetical protein
MHPVHKDEDAMSPSPRASVVSTAPGCHPDETEVGRPGSCASCFTDFSLNAVVVPGLGGGEGENSVRPLVLTKWKDLGRCERRWEKEWNSFEHARMDRRCRAYRVTMRQRRRAIFRCFEEVDDPLFSYGGPDHVHRPRVKPLDLVRLKEFPSRLEFEGEECGQPHRPGPDGIIYYPDPYKDNTGGDSSI